MPHAQQPPEVQWNPECVICKGSVKLEECKADENGQAIHEECYVSKITLEASDKLKKGGGYAERFR
jgi:hypothetical protein